MEKNVGKSLVAFSRKFHLKIAKFQILPTLIPWLGELTGSVGIRVCVRL